MKAASILLALVVVLGFVKSAGAYYAGEIVADHNYTIWIAGQQFGFSDGKFWDPVNSVHWGLIHLGPVGNHQVPITATQGLIGFCFILALLIIMPAVLTVRWKKKQAVV